jgi:hypothetical protein
MEIKIKDHILILRFISKTNMNKILDPISDSYEGKIINRIGHNFPIEYVTNDHIFAKYKKNNLIKYVVAVSDFKDLKHEMLHAKFYLDQSYKNSIITEFNNLESAKRNHIITMLKKMSYPDDKIIDEYQAYTYSEKSNFWGWAERK